MLMATLFVLLHSAAGTESKAERTVFITSIEHHESTTEHPYKVEAKTSGTETTIYYELACKGGAADLEVGRFYKASEGTEGGTKRLLIFHHVERDPTVIGTVCDVESVKAQPDEADLPLSSKDAAVGCGKVLKLNTKEAFEKLDIDGRLSSVVDDSGFTEEEFKEWMPAKNVHDLAFQAYSFAYVSWEKSTEVSRASFDKMVVDVARSVDLTKLSPNEKVQFDGYIVKLKRMMLKAFDLGRRDAKTSPCPF